MVNKKYGAKIDLNLCSADSSCFQRWWLFTGGKMKMNFYNLSWELIGNFKELLCLSENKSTHLGDMYTRSGRSAGVRFPIQKLFVIEIPLISFCHTIYICEMAIAIVPVMTPKRGKSVQKKKLLWGRLRPLIPSEITPRIYFSLKSSKNSFRNLSKLFFRNFLKNSFWKSCKNQVSSLKFLKMKNSEILPRFFWKIVTRFLHSFFRRFCENFSRNSSTNSTLIPTGIPSHIS